MTTKEDLVFYIDSSMILSRLLREKNDSSEWLELKEKLCTSEITELECRRTLDRIRLQEHLADNEIAERLEELTLLLKALHIIKLNVAVLKRAKAPYPTVVRSLDAIHLASAELSKSSVFMTCDKQQSIAARALGFKIGDSP